VSTAVLATRHHSVTARALVTPGVVVRPAHSHRVTLTGHRSPRGCRIRDTWTLPCAWNYTPSMHPSCCSRPIMHQGVRSPVRCRSTSSYITKGPKLTSSTSPSLMVGRGGVPGPSRSISRQHARLAWCNGDVCHRLCQRVGGLWPATQAAGAAGCLGHSAQATNPSPCPSDCIVPVDTGRQTMR
jgi:hypothetical protein